MGQEARCTVRFGDQTAQGKALLETDELIFRGDQFRLVIPFKAMKSVASQDGELTVNFPDGIAIFSLGSLAEKWARKILNPKSLLDKLGVKAGMAIGVVGVEDEGFLVDLDARTQNLTLGEGAIDSDMIFVAVDGPADVARLAPLKSQIKPNGAIWAVFRKGRKDFNENDLLRGGLEAGLVDVKVVKFSETHAASKFVIRKADRENS